MKNKEVEEQKKGKQIHREIQRQRDRGVAKQRQRDRDIEKQRKREKQKQ